MKIIDFGKKGNVVRFYLGADDCNDYYGDDWDDTPYEHNAGPVYDEFVEDYVDVVFPFGWSVMEPQDDWHYRGNSPYCKDDMKERMCPCVIAVKPELANDAWDDSYSCWATADNHGVVKYFFGDHMEAPEKHLVVIENVG